MLSSSKLTIVSIFTLLALLKPEAAEAECSVQDRDATIAFARSVCTMFDAVAFDFEDHIEFGYGPIGLFNTGPYGDAYITYTCQRSGTVVYGAAPIYAGWNGNDTALSCIGRSSTVPITSPTPVPPAPVATPVPTPTPRPTATPTPAPTATPVEKPTDLEPPTADAPPQVKQPALTCGSIIHVDNRSIGERVSIVGAPFDLVYFSDRVVGRTENYSINIPVSGNNVSGLAGIVLQINVAGQSIQKTFPPTANQSYSFVWNGRNQNGQLVEGSAAASITIIYVALNNSVQTATYSRNLGRFQAQALGLGGWVPSNVHFLDLNRKEISLGSGTGYAVEPISYKGGWLVSSQDGNEAYLFNVSGQHLETRDTLTGAMKMQFAYDASGRIISETDTFGNKTQMVFSGNLPSEIVSPYGQITKLQTDSNGYLSSIIDPAGGTHTLSTAANGLLQSFAKPNGHSSSFTYEASGKLIKDLASSGSSSGFSESVDAEDTTFIQKLTALNRKTNYTSYSDEDGYTRITKNSDGSQTISQTSDTVSYDRTVDNLVQSSTKVGDARFGSMAPVTATTRTTVIGSSFVSTSATSQSAILNNADPLSLNTLVTSTIIGGDQNQKSVVSFIGSTRTVSSVSPEGQTASIVLNEKSQPIKITSGQLLPTSIGYDTHGRKSSIAQGSRVTSFSYDSVGNVSAIKSPLGLTTSMKYDLAGHVTQQTRPDGKSIKFSYDASGNLTSLTPANNFVHSFRVNLNDDVSSYQPPLTGKLNTGETLYSYNLDRQLTQVQKPDGSKLNYNYDPSTAQLLSVQGAKNSISYAYDAKTKKVSSIKTDGGVQTDFKYVGPLKTSEATSGIGPTQSLGLGYSTDMKLNAVSLGSGTGLSKTISISYDRDSRPVKIGDESFVIDASSGLLKSATVGSVKESLNYSTYGEKSSDTFSVGSKALFAATYVRNAAGQITQKIETYGNRKIRQDFTYDNLGRLTSERVDGIPLLNYSYDVNGNRLKTSGLFGFIHANEKYDEQDRLLQFGDATFNYDNNGNRIKKSVPAGRWRSNDTIYGYDSFGRLSSVLLPGGKRIDYVIDGLGRRIGKKLNGKLVQGFVYQSQYQIAAETDGSGQVIRRFVYGSKANVPDYMITKDGTFRLITDQVGSLRMIVNTATGRIVDETINSAFGEISLDCRKHQTPFGFAGGLLDRDTGLVHFGEREYDAQVGRWISKDPIGFAGHDTNLYGYAINDPINLTDPSGKVLGFDDVLLIVGGAAVANAIGNVIGTEIATHGHATPSQLASAATSGLVTGAVAGALAVAAGESIVAGIIAEAIGELHNFLSSTPNVQNPADIVTGLKSQTKPAPSCGG